LKVARSDDSGRDWRLSPRICGGTRAVTIRCGRFRTAAAARNDPSLALACAGRTTHHARPDPTTRQRL